MNTNCRDCSVLISSRKTYCQECCLERQRERCRRYKRNNRDKISDYNKKYKSEFKEQISEYNRVYNINNRETIQKRQNVQHRERRKTDMNYKMSVVLRSRLRKFYTGKSSGITNLLDCDLPYFLKWMEYNFTSDMSWNNHGTLWHVDHVLPCSLYDLTTPNDQSECFHWSNMRPLHASKNNIKNNTIDMRYILHHELSIYFFNREFHKHFGYLTTNLLSKVNRGDS